ncbi:PSD1 and planctomycete cytochrome C domain-containing protein [Lewinella sp. JB7]|uniref:PSD1 and planctomycete cytochrome C domain-containing protein n=1 Tax=Lewinella sp. JB7 TaxID=2962887 RepID=UPI0020C97921|nr:PSD1 and planctomycete cytochrome C domain-containing protein [Lewinella sp. JB7]MCP9235741.1 PSD1 and planctomycete cytochrome C domain-containing protein [Lewinella sp. JB7]
MRTLFALTLLCLLGCRDPEPRVSFSADVRPIFNAKCVGCHGGVKQAGDLGLIYRAEALRAVVPGSPGRSELIQRIRHADPDQRMPLEGPPLTEPEIATLERWIEQGAEWEEHWAYVAPDPAPPRSAVPADGNEIDAYVADGLLAAGFSPAPASPPATLLRRLSFDLTGLPPTPAEMEEFLRNPDDEAYVWAVDRYLASPRYGEHRAAAWLDLARYADSRGYERDRPRTIWPYRDWVIRAFNDDMPFDQFTVEQLAGDLLPNPTRDQLIATAFHRNTPSNGEGGTSNEEYRTVSVLDRVNTTWEVWQGTTMACVQCHGHPYDPIPQEAYYASYAFFNNTADHDHVWERPTVSIPSARLRGKIDSLQSWIMHYGTSVEQDYWHRALQTREPIIRPYAFTDVVGGVFTDRADEDFMVMRHGSSFALPPLQLDSLAALHFHAGDRSPYTMEIRLDDTSGQIVATYDSEQNRGGGIRIVPLTPTAGSHRLSVTVRSTEDQPGPLTNIYGFHPQPRLPGEEQAGYEQIRSFIDELAAAPDSLRVPVMSENPPLTRRTTQLFERGNWLVPGRVVTADVPDILPPLPADGARDRLAFARWLTSPDHPLTARVAVNRIWAELFGTGIVATPEDFGSQGAAPSHPDLLDWLAVHYATELQWSTKRLIRFIVLSKTYRQSSAIRPEPADDPDNRLLARGPRGRLTAEQIRDQMLAVSGLLSDKMYGPGVMPPQPDGLWDHIPYSDSKWETSSGPDRYRRAVYTYLRRSVVHPSLTTFDGSSREICLSRRTETNTPLQALATLNDPAFTEAMYFLTDAILRETDDPTGAIDRLFRRVLYRPIREAERQELRLLYEEALRQSDHQAREALFVVTNVLFNLDEFLTKS